MLKKLETELKIRGFSPKTINAYVSHNKRFLEFCKKDVEQVDENDVKAYMAHLMDKGQKPASVSLAMSAIRFLYDEMLDKGIFVKIKLPKAEKKLPTVLSKDEIRKILNVTKNPKHKLLIELMYSSGLRVSECVKLKIGDIDIGRKVGIVNQGKGRKDRLFLLSGKFLEDFNGYIAKRNNGNNYDAYVFNDYANGHITTRTAEKIIKNAAKKAGIMKRVHCHMMRASFATHLFEENVKEEYIQRLMGHARRETLQRYLSVKVGDALKVKSPLDNL